MNYPADHRPIRTSPVLGDEAILYIGPGGDHLLFRTSNMIGIVTTTGTGLNGSGLADAIARDAFDRLEPAA